MKYAKDKSRFKEHEAHCCHHWVDEHRRSEKNHQYYSLVEENALKGVPHREGTLRGAKPTNRLAEKECDGEHDAGQRRQDEAELERRHVATGVAADDKEQQNVRRDRDRSADVAAHLDEDEGTHQEQRHLTAAAVAAASSRI